MTNPIAADEEIIRRLTGWAGEIEYTDEGWDSRVYIIEDGEIVFKFPRWAEIGQRYAHEAAMLRLLESFDPQPLTPRVTWEGTGGSYLGYRGVQGEQLARRLPHLDETTKASVGHALGLFLRLLHESRLPGVTERDVERELTEYGRKFEMSLPALEAALSGHELETVERFFREELPAELRGLGGELCLCHGDLGPWNVILTPENGVGVIDFGDLAYQDTSTDFSGLGDATILNAAFDGYQASDLMRRRAGIRIRAFPVLDIPFYLGKHDEAGVRSCIEVVRKVLIQDSAEGRPRFARG